MKHKKSFINLDYFYRLYYYLITKIFQSAFIVF